MNRSLALTLGALAFLLLSTANAGGYRYGVSDQAFYIPAAVLAADPSAYPHDAPLITAEARLLVADDLVGALTRATGIDLPWLFLAGYVATMLTLAAAATAFSRGLGLSWPATTAALALLTFRHRIARTGANSTEGYLHPRMLAFALGLAACSAFVRGRAGWTIAAVAAAALAHPTTGFWFGLALFAALVVDRPAWRRPMAALAAAGAAAAIWAVTAGPLANSLVVMDDAWLAVLAEKDYLFPTDWPVYAWLLNLLYPVVLVAVYRQRAAAGLTSPAERALLMGLLSLVGVFLLSVPFTTAKVALAVQVQSTRVFWLLDAVFVIALAWWLVDRPVRRAAPRWTWQPILVAALLVAASAGRGAYLLTIEAPERRLFAPTLPRSPWHDVAAWLREQPAHWHVLADPGHAWRYGTSLRVSARRDTLVESVKDAAISMYDRDVAMRVADRLHAVGRYADLSADAFRGLATRYDLDVAVVDGAPSLDLPVLYRNAQFVVYDLR